MLNGQTCQVDNLNRFDIGLSISVAEVGTIVPHVVQCKFCQYSGTPIANLVEF
jgi:hypothetical protein